MHAELNNNYHNNDKQENCTRNVTNRIKQIKNKCKDNKTVCEIKLSHLHRQTVSIKDIYHNGETIADAHLKSLKYNSKELSAYSPIQVLKSMEIQFGDLEHRGQLLRYIHNSSFHLSALVANEKIRFVDMKLGNLTEKKSGKAISILNLLEDLFARGKPVALGDLKYSGKNLRDIKFKDACFTENGNEKISVEFKCVEKKDRGDYV